MTMENIRSAGQHRMLVPFTLSAGLLLSSCLSDSPPPWVEEPVAAPSAPSLTLPADGATVSTNPVLSWNEDANAISWNLVVSLTASFAGTLVESQTVYSGSSQILGLSPGTQYYWRVSASGSGGTSGYSATRSFITESPTATPAVPTLVTPTSGATGVSTNSSLSWNPVDGAASYRLQVSLSSEFSSTLYDQSGTETSRQVSGLTPSTLYYWRVSASNAIGTSSYSVTRSFTTSSTITAPSAPAQLSPSSGATGVSTVPVFTWRASGGATSYRLQVSSSNSFSGTLVYNQGTDTDTSQSISGLSPNTMYYWRVGASNTAGTTYSSARSFTTRSPIAGEQWTLRNATSNSILSMAWGNGRFVAVTPTGFLTSSNGIDWTIRQSGTVYDQDLEFVMWSGSQFVAISNRSQGRAVLASTDGISWTAILTGITSNLNSIAKSNSLYVAVGANGVIITSPDAITWTSQASVVTTTLNSVVWSGSQFVAVGNSVSGGTTAILTSSNGTSWALRSSGLTNYTYLNSVSYTGSQFVAVGDNSGTILTSPDGVAWTQRPSNAGSTLQSVVSSGSMLVAVGRSGTIVTSSDGISWAKPVSGTSSTLNTIVWSGTQFVVGASNGTVITSP